MNLLDFQKKNFFLEGFQNNLSNQELSGSKIDFNKMDFFCIILKSES